MSLAGVWCRWLRQHVLHGAQHGVGRLLLVAERQEWCFLVCCSGLPSFPVAWSSRWCRLCAGAACQSLRLVEEFPVLRCRVVALFALGNLDFAFALVSFSPWCVGVACGVQRMVSGRVRCLVQKWIHVYGRLWTNFSTFYVAANSNPEAFSIRFEWRSVHSRCFWLQSLQCGSHVETWTLFLQALHFWQFAAVFSAQCSGPR